MFLISRLPNTEKQLKKMIDSFDGNRKVYLLVLFLLDLDYKTKAFIAINKVAG